MCRKKGRQWKSEAPVSLETLQLSTTASKTLTLFNRHHAEPELSHAPNTNNRIASQCCKQLIGWKSNDFKASFCSSPQESCAGKIWTKERFPERWKQRCICAVASEPNFPTQLSPTAAKQQRTRQRRKEKKNYKGKRGKKENDQINRTLPEVQRR